MEDCVWGAAIAWTGRRGRFELHDNNMVFIAENQWDAMAVGSRRLLSGRSRQAQLHDSNRPTVFLISTINTQR